MNPTINPEPSEVGFASALRAVVDVLPIDPDSGMAIVGWTSPVDSEPSARWGAPEILAERVIQALVDAGLLRAPAPVLDPLAEFGRRRAAELNARGADVCPVCLAPRDNGTCRWCPATAEVCDQCAGLGWVRIKGYVYGAICGYETATECMACNPDGRIAYTGQIDFGDTSRPLTEVP